MPPASAPTEVSPKRVLLRRPLQAVPSTSEIPSEESLAATGSPNSERRKVLLAHKIKPGQTIQLKASKATATMRDDGQPEMQAESLVHAAARPPVGPQYGAGGDLLSFSVLGPVEEFAEQVEARDSSAAIARHEASMPYDDYGVPPSDVDGTHAHLFGQLDGSLAAARTKNESASLRQRHSEALAAQQSRTWRSQMSALATQLDVPAGSLMMARANEYRGRVQERQVLEALRRQQYPYGGDRAWQIGLRAGGVFYEAIGNPSNGIFCPFRAPNDSEALARAGALAADPYGDEPDLSLAALESKILGEQQRAAADGAQADYGATPTGVGDGVGAGESDADDDFIDPEAYDVVSADHLNEIARLRDKYNIEGAAPAHLSGDERVLWGIFKEIDTDESGEVSKQELYAAFGKMGLVASAAEMLRLFREGDIDGNGRIDCDEFIALGQKVDVFAGAAEAFSNKDAIVKKSRKRTNRIAVNKGSQLGPILSVSAERLGFEANAGQLIESSLEMRNDGSTAMYYEWERVPVSAALGATSVVDAAAQFYTNGAKGCILPQTSATMRFTFQPAKAGIFHEEWRLKLTPPTAQPIPPVLLRGVCLSAPESEKKVLTLNAELERRKLWFACQDLLLGDVLTAVYRKTIPDGVRIDAILTPSSASAPAPTPAPTAEAVAAMEAEARFKIFINGYGAVQALRPTAARTCFDALDEIAAQLPVGPPPPPPPAVEDSAADEEAAPAAEPPAQTVGVEWGGDVHALEEALAAASAHATAMELWERFEMVLQHAASATPDVSCVLRSRHVAAVCAEAALFRGAAAVARSRQLYAKSIRGVTGPVSASGQNTLNGKPVAWCWETERYEPAGEMEAIGAAARSKRLEAEHKAAAAKEWELKKAGMSKRDRKKAEKEEEKAAAAEAVAQEAAAVAAEEAARVAKEAEERRLADPAVQKEMAYRKDVHAAVQSAVEAMLDSYVEQAFAMEQERM